jgi:hypothetical protein
MVNDVFMKLVSVISNRRNVKPQAMNGKTVNDSLINEILQLADYAPNHGLTEPWRFIVFGPEARSGFCRQHAELYLANTLPGKFEQAKYDKLFHMGDLASHIVIAIMKRGNLPKIPSWKRKQQHPLPFKMFYLGPQRWILQAIGEAVEWPGMMHEGIPGPGYRGSGDGDLIFWICR